MDRLTTGRRRLRAGSVSVNELLVKQASPAPCTESSPASQDVVPASHRRGETKGAQLAKLASIGVATAVLCGAVAIASTVGQHRRDVAQQPARPAARITGGQALLPDRIDPTTPTVQDTPTTVPTPPAAPPAPVERTEEPTTEPPSAPAPGGTTTSSGDSSVGAPTDLELVREFYEKLPTAPAAAFDLLAPDLLHTSLGDFLESWSLVRTIDHLHLVQRPDGVLATVRMRLADGGHLKLEQLLTVAEVPRRIVGVQLLSAQRN